MHRQHGCLHHSRMAAAATLPVLTINLAPQYECQDIQGDASLFEALGVGLSRSEMVDVALAAKAVGQDPRRGVATVR